MIVNKYSVLSLFVDSLGLALAAVLAITASVGGKADRAGHGTQSWTPAGRSKASTWQPSSRRSAWQSW